MTQEQKAKAYDEALERAKLSRQQLQDIGEEATEIEYIFPELKESEDGRIQQMLMAYFKGLELSSNHKGNVLWQDLKVKDILTWLEKQGNSVKECLNLPHFTFDDILALQCCMETIKKVQEDKELYEALLLLHDKVYDAYHLKKQGEQKSADTCDSSTKKGKKFPIGEKRDFGYFSKSADKIEPKFHKGQWITNSIETVQITGYDIDYGYQVDYKGNLQHRDTDIIEKEYHLWTIADAKDGDILCAKYENGEMPFIFTGKQDNAAYCALNSFGEFLLPIAEWSLKKNYVLPATKEQRDILFKAMHEAGYEFDFDRLELRKIEQKSNGKIEPKFKVGDWIVDNCINVNVWKIEGIINQFYILEDIEGGESRPTIEWVDKNFHLWTIQDAKNGDVLHSTGFHNDCIFIFNGLDNWKFEEPNGDRAVATGYCCLFVSADNMEFGIQGPDCIEVNTIKPATKIQRDLLFRKMKVAGYEWNPTTKELVKVSEKADVCDGCNNYKGCVACIDGSEKARLTAPGDAKHTEYSTMLQMIWDKVYELKGKLGDIYQVVSKPYQYFPYSINDKRCWFEDGTCLNPHRDCINCPRPNVERHNITTTTFTDKKEE